MKKIFTLSFILFAGFSLSIANPRNFPSNNNGNNNHGNGNTNSPNSGNNSSSNNYGSNHNNNNNHNYGSNNHGSNNNHNNHGNHHGNNYPSYPKPVIVVRPRPIIVPRPVYVSRPVIQYNIPSSRPNYNYNTPSYQGFNFKNFMYTLKNQSYDSDRLSIARQALSNNYFDTYQIREVMSIMDFEKNRVEFAKDAYNNCVDKQNYFRVNDAFEFSSSIQELEDYIFVRR